MLQLRGAGAPRHGVHPQAHPRRRRCPTLPFTNGGIRVVIMIDTEWGSSGTFDGGLFSKEGNIAPLRTPHRQEAIRCPARCHPRRPPPPQGRASEGPIAALHHTRHPSPSTIRPSLIASRQLTHTCHPRPPSAPAGLKESGHISRNLKWGGG